MKRFWCFLCLLTVLATRAYAAPIFAVDTSNTLLRFDSATPGTVTGSTPITGLGAGETIIGIDGRPANGLLYVLTRNASNVGRLYTLNRATAVATLVATLTADPADTTAPFTALNGTRFGVDFNPVPDRLRVVSDTDQNLRINPVNGLTTTDGPLAFDTDTDGTGPDTGDANAGANPNIVGSGYTNNFAGATTTTLYDIDSTLNILTTQNPPNSGTLNTTGALGVDTTDLVGFDITRTNEAFAVLDVGAVSELYSINLASGAASLIGAVGGNPDIVGIAVDLDAPVTFVVNSTADGADANVGDGVCQTATVGQCTLRAAIQEANANENRDTITFNIAGGNPPGAPAPPPFIIFAAGSALPTITDPVFINGNSQPRPAGFPAGFPIVALNGAFAGANATGLTINGGGSTVRGLAIQGFGGDGIELAGPRGGNFIQGVVSGKGAANQSGNGLAGVFINNSPNNTLGGLSLPTAPGAPPADACLFSGNGRYGVEIIGAGATANTLTTNVIGTDPSTNVALPNGQGGVLVDDADGNFIGIINPVFIPGLNGGNIISGNTGAGLTLRNFADGNSVQANNIGTNQLGQVPANSNIGNTGIGILIVDSRRNEIGGQVAPPRPPGTTPRVSSNTISSNGDDGIRIVSDFSDNNRLRGIIVGFANGAAEGSVVPAGNGGNGVSIIGAVNTIIGNERSEAIAAGTVNFIGSNVGDGITISGGASGTRVVRNNIGVFGQANSNGTVTLVAAGNRGDGISISDSSNNVIGTSAATSFSNLIFSNGDDGISITGNTSTGNRIEGNLIGFALSAPTQALGNADDGISIEDARNTIIGTPAEFSSNSIGGNGDDGISIAVSAGNTDSVGTRVQNNIIGFDAAGTRGKANGGDGVFLNVNSANVTTTIGGTADNTDNTIRGNAGNGVQVGGSGSGSVIVGNSIFLNGGLGINLIAANEAPNAVTPNDVDDADSGPNGLQNFPIITGISRQNGSFVVDGTLNTNPGSGQTAFQTTYAIDLYSNDAPDPSGFGEGQTLLASTIITANFRGEATFSIPVNSNISGKFLSATATSPPASASANVGTSEFGPAVQVGAEISIDDVTVIEDDGGGSTNNAVLTVRLREASSQTVSVSFTTVNGSAGALSEGFQSIGDPQDFRRTTGNLVFAAGETTKTISVPIFGDVEEEADEQFTVVLSNNSANSTIADREAVVTIIDTDRLVSVANVTVVEGDAGLSNAEFTITISAASKASIAVGFATANGTATAGSDYQSTSGTLTFAPGETSKTVRVPILADTLDESNETFFLNVSGNRNGLQATGTIADDDGEPALTLSDARITEGNDGTRNAAFTARLSRASGLTFTVNFATADGTATAGSDYQSTSGTLTFAPGETSKVINVPIFGDRRNESDETFTLVLSNPGGAPLVTATGTIANDDEDTAPNSVSFSSPTNGATVSNLTTITGTALDNVGGSGISRVDVFVRRLSDGQFFNGTGFGALTALPTTYSGTTFTANLPTGLNDGEYELTATAVDVAGNSTSTTIRVTVDRTAPTAITITTPSDNAILTDLPTIAGFVSGEARLARVEVSILSQAAGYFNGSSFVAAATALQAQISGNSFSLTTGLNAQNVVEGTYTISVRAFDAAGNSRETSVQVLIDTRAPRVVITSPTNRERVTNLSAIAGVAIDALRGSGVTRVDLFVQRAADRRFFNGTNFSSTTAVALSADYTRTTGRFVRRAGLPSSSVLTPGRYIISARAIDRAGRIGRASVEILVPGNAPSAALAFSGTDAAKFAWEVSG